MAIQKTEDPRFGVRAGQRFVINTDNEGYRAFLSERQNFIGMKKAVSEVDSLRSQVQNLTEMMQQLLAQQKQNGSK